VVTTAAAAFRSPGNAARAAQRWETGMQGSFLRFYVTESQRHRGVLLWEWLLEQGNTLGVRGGSAFRSIGGFGRRHAMHEDRFFELAGTGGVEVEFVVGEEEEERLLALIRQEKIRLFYTRIPACFGVINPDADDAPDLTA
jgi:PII-like signaling protein